MVMEIIPERYEPHRGGASGYFWRQGRFPSRRPVRTAGHGVPGPPPQRAGDSVSERGVGVRPRAKQGRSSGGLEQEIVMQKTHSDPVVHGSGQR